MRRGNLQNKEAGGVGGEGAAPFPQCTRWWTQIPLLLLLLLLLLGARSVAVRGGNLKIMKLERGWGEGAAPPPSELAGGLRFLCCCCCSSSSSCCRCCCNERSCERRQLKK